VLSVGVCTLSNKNVVFWEGAECSELANELGPIQLGC